MPVRFYSPSCPKHTCHSSNSVSCRARIRSSQFSWSPFPNGFTGPSTFKDSRGLSGHSPSTASPPLRSAPTSSHSYCVFRSSPPFAFGTTPPSAFKSNTVRHFRRPDPPRSCYRSPHVFQSNTASEFSPTAQRPSAHIRLHIPAEGVACVPPEIPSVRPVLGPYCLSSLWVDSFRSSPIFAPLPPSALVRAEGASSHTAATFRRRRDVVPVGEIRLYLIHACRRCGIIEKDFTLGKMTQSRERVGCSQGRARLSSPTVSKYNGPADRSVNQPPLTILNRLSNLTQMNELCPIRDMPAYLKVLDIGYHPTVRLLIGLKVIFSGTVLQWRKTCRRGVHSHLCDHGLKM
jgi:hypothetical protein